SLRRARPQLHRAEQVPANAWAVARFLGTDCHSFRMVIHLAAQRVCSAGNLGHRSFVGLFVSSGLSASPGNSWSRLDPDYRSQPVGSSVGRLAGVVKVVVDDPAPAGTGNSGWEIIADDHLSTSALDRRAGCRVCVWTRDPGQPNIATTM